MDRPVRAIVLTVPAHASELAADRLWQAGAVAVEERTIATGIELWSSLGDDESIAVERLGAIDPAWRVRFEIVDTAWSHAWRSYARPIPIAPDLVVQPAWLPIEPGAAVHVVIEPGAAFGLGDHPTTRLSAAGVRRLVRPDDRVLDVGCGTGVLAIVALVSGAASAVAIDISPAALEVTRANAVANRVADRLVVGDQPVGEIDGRFDLVVANILAPALVAMAPDLRRLTSATGRLVVSGILEARHDHVLDALAPMVAVRTDVVDGWAAVELRHPRVDTSAATEAAAG